MSCNNEVKVKNIGEIAIDNLATLPDYILAERDVEDASTGNMVRTPVRVPSSKLFPNVSQDNVIGLEINNTALVVPEKQVRAGYISDQPGALIMEYADASHPAVFIMLGKYNDNIMRVQNTGFINIPEGHEYIINTIYYVGENGEPTTDESITGQKLFIPVSNTKLAVVL